MNRRPFLRPGRLVRPLIVATLALGLVSLAVGAARSLGSVDWSSGFEGQSWSPWQGLQHDENEPLSASFRFVTSPVRTGRYAAEFIVRQGEGPAWGTETTELCCGPTGEGTPGTEHWWAWSTYFPTDWTEPYHWGLFFQLHAGDDMPPAIAFDAGGDAAWVDIRTGSVDPSGPSWSYGAFPRILDTLSKGRWNDFVLHVRWSLTDGQVQVWHRVAGEGAFAQVLDLDHVPTLQQYPSGRIAGIYTKLGLYRDSYCKKPVSPGCTSPLGVQPTNVVYDDSFVRGSSFREVVAAAWGAAGPTSSPPGAQTRSAPPGRLGTWTAGTAVDPGGADYVDVSGPYRLARKARVVKLRGLIAGERRAMSVRGLVYADRGGRPGVLVATTREVEIAAGSRRAWVDLPLAAPVPLRAGAYWLGYWYGPGVGSGNGGFRYEAADGAEAYAGAPYRSTGAGPRRFPRPSVASSRYALYAVTTAAPGR